MNQLDTLTRINLDDLVSSFGWGAQPLPAGLLRGAFHGPARKFAAQMVDFDSAVGRLGLVHAARLMQRLYARDVRVFGADRISDGPLLALSNHPGMTDTLALFAALQRDDLRIIALRRPFLQSIPNMASRLFFVTEDAAERMTLVRHVSGHLRAGGAVLTFPAGIIEPDPEVYPGAVEALKGWTDSADVFLRLAPETAVLPVLVRGVIWKQTARHPLLSLKRGREDRERLAAALQLLAMVMWNVKPVTVTVQIGRPITARGLGTTDVKALHQAVLGEMKLLIENPPAGPSVSAL